MQSSSVFLGTWLNCCHETLCGTPSGPACRRSACNDCETQIQKKKRVIPVMLLTTTTIGLVYLGSKVISPFKTDQKMAPNSNEIAMNCQIAEEHNTSVRKGSGVPLLIKHQVGPSNKKLGEKRGDESNIWLLELPPPPTQDAIVTNYRVIPSYKCGVFSSYSLGFQCLWFCLFFPVKTMIFFKGFFGFSTHKSRGLLFYVIFTVLDFQGICFQSAVLIVMSKWAIILDDFSC